MGKLLTIKIGSLPTGPWFVAPEAPYRAIGTVYQGIEFGALAIAPDGSYVRVNGSAVRPLNAFQVEKALRKEAQTRRRAVCGGASPPPRWRSGGPPLVDLSPPAPLQHQKPRQQQHPQNQGREEAPRPAYMASRDSAGSGTATQPVVVIRKKRRVAVRPAEEDALGTARA